ncbi:MAG: hypothetical protein NTY03_16100, partial [Candidatus Bathyarchaeota archaeon]|nr:hypothetical protein [Candidatus Bathyarchaeota archaeon]
IIVCGYLGEGFCITPSGLSAIFTGIFKDLAVTIALGNWVFLVSLLMAHCRWLLMAMSMAHC